MFRILPFVCFLFVFISCNREDVEEVNTNYIGTWTGQDETHFYTIEVNTNGEGEYQKANANANEFFTGKTKVWKDKLKIGKKKFNVNEEPTLKVDAFGNSFYQMQLDKIIYIRYV